MGLQPGRMLPRAQMRRAVIVELCSLPKLHSGQACSNSPVVLLSLTVTCHIAVCVRITWYHTWMMEAKWYCVGEPLLTPYLQHRETNGSDHSCIVSES